MSCKVVLRDMYDGVANVYTPRDDMSANQIEELVDDFLRIVGDQLYDMQAYDAATRLRMFMKHAGIPVKVNSTKPANELVAVNLVNAEITSAKLVETYEPVEYPHVHKDLEQIELEETGPVSEKEMALQLPLERRKLALKEAIRRREQGVRFEPQELETSLASGEAG